MTPPVVPLCDTQQVAEGVHVVPDHRIALVPNFGTVEGRDVVLVVDTAMGPANGERVLAERYAAWGNREWIAPAIGAFHREVRV